MTVSSSSGRIAIAITLSFGVAVALVGVAHPGGSLGSTAAGVIAFGRSPPSVDTSLYRCRGTIYTIRADGTEREAIGPGGCPAWSPDGKRLAVASGRGIVVMDADGANRRQITQNRTPGGFGGDAYPTWSPDGRRIAFLRIHCCLDRPSLIFVVPAKGGRLTRVARTDGDVAGGGTGEVEADLAFGPVSWSPDGRRIAYARCVAFGGHLVWGVKCHLETVGVNGRGRRKGGAISSRPAWSPTGTDIAVTGRIGNRSVIRIVRDGVKGGRTLVRCDCGQLKWSPDGHLLAFDDGGLSVIAASGGHVQRLTPPVRFLSDDFSWSADSQEIAFIRTTDTVIYKGRNHTAFAAQLEVVRADTKEVRTLDSGEYADAYAAWRPTSDPNAPRVG